MKLKEPKNSNYCATVIEIKTLVPLDNCDNVQAAIIFGNQVIVSKETKIGDIGLFFPVETKLSKEYLSSNNLYRKKELNLDTTKGGYFEENGRIRCVKFRGNKSEGLFMPLSSVINLIPIEDVEDYNIDLHIGDEFDELEGIEVCRKYIPKNTRTPGTPGSKKSKKPKESKLVENQFRFHQDTNQLYKNTDRIFPDSLISITYKVHGTSGISSYILCNKKLTWYNKLFKALGVDIITSTYDYIFSSRKVIKNEDLHPNANHFYSDNIWSSADKDLRPFLKEGMTFYYEIVGYLPNSSTMIQKDYDYGCDEGTYKIFIYRITYTSPTGNVFEYSAKQLQDFCKKNGLNPVIELYYGYASEWSDERLGKEKWQAEFLTRIKSNFNEHNCFLCSNNVPEEGVVIRVEGLDFEAYKQKSNRFYERETKKERCAGRP